MAANRRSKTRTLLAVAACYAAAAGCSGLENSPLSDFGFFAGSDGGSQVEEAKRNLYVSQKDHDAMHWLLVHRIRTGMRVSEVSMVFGEEGEQVYEDNWIKKGVNHYQDGDVVYRWGPDSRGSSVYLVFRDGRLVNFDPKEFEKS